MNIPCELKYEPETGTLILTMTWLHIAPIQPPEQVDKPKESPARRKPPQIKETETVDDPLSGFVLHVSAGDEPHRANYRGREFEAGRLRDVICLALGTDDVPLLVSGYPESDNKKLIMGIF